jgi:hypothetical protein
MNSGRMLMLNTMPLAMLDEQSMLPHTWHVVMAANPTSGSGDRRCTILVKIDERVINTHHHGLVVLVAPATVQPFIISLYQQVTTKDSFILNIPRTCAFLFGLHMMSSRIGDPDLSPIAHLSM